ncbi:flagellar motor switch protein FliG [Citricoccus sp. K5]|uniref:flagellar motor switch protein FliG n=1 Tax=Citricoccus sp. K5 TaxID=2653135 RepID=UPI0012EFCA1D|nr:flagellar motor switch protein FliG [Citricoccus sp. K5]VXB63619.1 Flagellar motor switch protein FliG [Citricoccus sp. K5]
MKDVKLTGVQKVAVLLMDLDPVVASEVMSHFNEDEAQEVSAEIMRMKSADPDTVDFVMAELAAMVDSGRTPARGGAHLARRLISGAFGEDKAGDVMERAAGVLAGKAFEFLDTMDATQILALIHEETPQIQAVVLSNLDPRTASAVLSGLDDPVRNGVAFRIATMGTPSTEAVRVTAEILKSRVSSVATAREQAAIGGVQSLVEIVNRADSATERGVLEYMAATDPELGAEVRNLMFTFADLLRLDDHALQMVLRSIRMDVLARALRGANPALEQKIRRNMSSRNVVALNEESSAVSKLRTSEVEEARGEVVREVRALEAAGELDLSKQEEDEYV